MQWYRALLLLIIFLTTIICSLSATTSYPKLFGRRGSLMFSALVSGSSCPGSTWPGTWRCILGQDTLTVPLSAQVYKWVSTSLILRVSLRQTSIPSRGKQKYPSSINATETGISSSLMDHLARIQTFTLPKTFAKYSIHSVQLNLFMNIKNFPVLNTDELMSELWPQL